MWSVCCKYEMCGMCEVYGVCEVCVRCVRYVWNEVYVCGACDVRWGAWCVRCLCEVCVRNL